MKLPFSFATRLVFRLVLPGLFLSTALVPVGGLLLDAATIHVDRGLVFTFCVIILGWLITLLDMPIYMLFEGRRFWPRWCWQFFYKREQKRLNRIEQKYEAARAEGNYRKAVEFEVERSYFPLSETDGTPTAMYPTRLGNIITEYEQYPDRKYDMDGVFYWYRIWLSLDKDTRVELDEQQAIVDGAIYTSFILYITGFLFVIYAIIEGLAGIQMAKSLPPGLLLAVSFVAGPAGYIIYRISLPSQRQYGSLFKAMFDLHFKNVDVQPVLEIIAHRTGERWVRAERGPDAYRIAWRYLRWHRFRPRNSDHNINVEKASKVHKTVGS